MSDLKKVQNKGDTERIRWPLAWYFHVPFCVAKCHYCDFYSLGMGEKPLPEADFVQALCRELAQWQQWLKPEILENPVSIFWGGGTPSLLQAESVREVLTKLGRGGPVCPPWFFEGRHMGLPLPKDKGQGNIEITLEMNPRTASLEKLQALREAGVNRISMGAQTLNDTLLKNLGREHNAAAVHETLRILQELEWENYNLDLMYGLPQQKISDLQGTLEQLKPYGLKHLSAYELILEEHTPFFERYQYERAPLPPEKEVLVMRECLENFAAEQNMQPYEISNWASPGQECRHNLHYWNYGSFVGLGPSAVSFVRWEQLNEKAQQFFKKNFEQKLTQKEVDFGENGPIYGLRLTQERSLKNYLTHFGDIQYSQVEIIDKPTAMGEFFMMALRKRRGFHISEFEQCFGEAIPSAHQDVLCQSQQKGLLQEEGGQWSLTPEGILLSNEVMGSLVDLRL